MNYLVLLLGLIAGALWLPCQVVLTAKFIASEGGCKLNPNLKLYSILGALIGLMAGLGVIQAHVGLYGMLVAPGLVVGLALAEVLVIAAVTLVIVILQSVCERFCAFFRWFLI
jgi:hypothetical protein